MSRSLEVQDLGLISWRDALKLQLERVEQVAGGRAPATLYLLEHEPVVTLGRSGNKESLLVSEEELARRGVALEHARRGGDVTCHFPGQLVAYVVMPVDLRKGGLRQVFHDLEEAVISVLAGYGIAAERMSGRPGVWTQGRKIASIGLGVRRWVTFHGLALNVARDIGLFSLLTPCGLQGVEATSMELERAAAGISPWNVEMKEVKGVFRDAFEKHVAAA